jgi:hypothetical protein
LVDAARHAFITGSDQAMLIALAAALFGSLVAARFLPARPAGDSVPVRAEGESVAELAGAEAF